MNGLRLTTDSYADQKRLILSSAIDFISQNNKNRYMIKLNSGVAALRLMDQQLQQMNVGQSSELAGLGNGVMKSQVTALQLPRDDDSHVGSFDEEEKHATKEVRMEGEDDDEEELSDWSTTDDDDDEEKEEEVKKILVKKKKAVKTYKNNALPPRAPPILAHHSYSPLIHRKQVNRTANLSKSKVPYSGRS
jgi:hypothetical protein